MTALGENPPCLPCTRCVFCLNVNTVCVVLRPAVLTERASRMTDQEPPYMYRCLCTTAEQQCNYWHEIDLGPQQWLDSLLTTLWKLFCCNYRWCYDVTYGALIYELIFVRTVHCLRMWYKYVYMAMGVDLTSWRPCHTFSHACTVISAVRSHTVITCCCSVTYRDFLLPSYEHKR